MKILEMPKDFSVIFKFGNKKIIVADKLRYNTPVVDLNECHLSNIYMNRIGFKPFRTSRGLSTKKIDVYNNGNVAVSDVCIYDRNSSGSNGRGEIGTLEEVFPISEVFADFNFVLSKKGKSNSGQESIIVTKYNVKMNVSEELVIKELDSFWIAFDNTTGVQVGYGNLGLDIAVFKDFFKNVIDGEMSWSRYLPALIFDGFSDEYGFRDIFEEYRQILHESKQLDVYNQLCYFYYLGQKEYYVLCEYLIKNNMSSKIAELNPVFTKKPIPSPKDVFVLSKVSMEMIGNRNDKELINILTKCEKDSKISVNGIKIIYDVLQAYNKVDSYETAFKAYRYDDMFTAVYGIIQNFDITPKVLMDKCIRATFYENMEPSNYLRIIIDYFQMSKQLGIVIDRKLPQDVIRRHDLLQSQIEYVENVQIEKMFNNQIALNERLLKHMPTSKDLTIVCPKNPNDLIQEGLEMHHCVGSYIGRVAEGYSKIFFIRSKTNLNMPLVTVELNQNNLLVQSKAFSNASPNKAVLSFIDGWIEAIQKI